MLTAERLREVLDYDPQSGIFVWKAKTGPRVVIGDRAGKLEVRGYRTIGVDGYRCKEHRLAWLYVYSEWPPDQIDHINCVRDDNRISNLRLADNRLNQANVKLQRNNLTGFKGVRYHRPNGNWTARISFNRKSRFLGSFASPKAAHEAYCKAAYELFGSYARVS